MRSCRRARGRFVVVLALLALGASACNTTRFMANQMVGALEASRTAFNRERSPEQARAAAPASLSMVEGFIVSSPHNDALLLLAAEMNANAAFALIEPREAFGWLYPGLEPEEASAWAAALYLKAYRYAERALAERDEALARALADNDLEALRTGLAALEADDGDTIAALYWCAFAMGGAINLQLDDPDRIARLPAVLAIMERLAAIAPAFEHAGAHGFLAVYYSARGPAAGGDLRRANAHYREVFRRTGGRFLIPYVLYARFYCVALGASAPARARELFRKACRHVLETPADIDPDQVLANTIAKRWARWLLEDLDELIFPPLEDEAGGGQG